MIPLLSATNREVGARLSLLRLPPDFEEAYASTPFAYQREETLKVLPASPEVKHLLELRPFHSKPPSQVNERYGAGYNSRLSRGGIDLAVSSIPLRLRRWPQRVPSGERKMEKQVRGHHQRYIDNRNHVDTGARKAVTRHIQRDNHVAHAGSGCQHPA